MRNRNDDGFPLDRLVVTGVKEKPEDSAVRPCPAAIPDMPDMPWSVAAAVGAAPVDVAAAAHADRASAADAVRARTPSDRRGPPEPRAGREERGGIRGGGFPEGARGGAG